MSASNHTHGTPLVSVLIAVWNGQKTIQSTLEQVFAQTLRNYEVLVVDDASEDQTVAILKSISDVRLRILINDRNMGITASLHRGVLEARGRYVARIDDGLDRISSDWLAKCVGPLEGNANIVLSAPRSRSHCGNEVWESQQPNDPDILRWIFSLHNCVAHPGAIFRRVIDGETQNYDLGFEMAQDYELWSRLSRCGKVYIVPEVLVDIMYTQGSLTQEKKAKQDTYASKVRARQQNWLLARNDISESLANAAAGVYWRWQEVDAGNALRGSCLLRRLREAYLGRFGTLPMANYLSERFYGHARWLFRRADEASRSSRLDAIRCMIAAWLLCPSQVLTYRSFQIARAILLKQPSRETAPSTGTLQFHEKEASRIV